ncbi:MAG: transposase, partial [Methylococcaceae bacterium]|nr:transposase [Methylococcaceae bacterium]
LGKKHETLIAAYLHPRLEKRRQETDDHRTGQRAKALPGHPDATRKRVASDPAETQRKTGQIRCPETVGALQIHEASILLFAKQPYVVFTNKRAEQDLRMAKVKQKVSSCFRAEEYAHVYCRISSYLQTMANRGYNPLIDIQIALAGNAASLGRE